MAFFTGNDEMQLRPMVQNRTLRSAEDLWEKRWRLGAWIFLATIVIQGLPLERGLSHPQSVLLDELREETVATVTTLGYQNNFLYTAIWALLYMTSVMLVIRKEAKRTVLWVFQQQWPLALSLFLVPLSLLWTEYPGKVLMSSAHAIGTTFITLVAYLYYRGKPGLFVRHLGLVLGATLLLQWLSVLLLPDLTIYADDRWMGMTGQPNGLAGMAYCGIWANATAIVLNRKAFKALHLLAVGVSIVVLRGSYSVTAILASTVALSTLFLLTYVTKRMSSRRFWNGVNQLAILGVMALVILVMEAQNLVQIFAPMFGRSSDLTGRVFLWQDAIKLIREKPFLGWGFDDNAQVIVKTGMAFIQYHDGYLDVAVRGGLIALFLLGVSLAVFYQNVTRSKMDVVLMTIPFVLSMLIYNIAQGTLLEFRCLVWNIYVLLLFMALPYGVPRRWGKSTGKIMIRSINRTGVGLPVKGTFGSFEHQPKGKKNHAV